MAKSRSIYPKQVSLDKAENPLETTIEWIVKVCTGIHCKRTAPLQFEKLKSFFPFTSDELFHRAFKIAVEKNLIQRKLINYNNGYGYIIE